MVELHEIRILLDDINETSDDEQKIDLQEQLQEEIRTLIDRYGRYDENSYIWGLVKKDITKIYGNYGFQDIYEEIEEEETYHIKLSFMTENVTDEEEYEVIEDFKNYLYDFEYDEIDDYRLSLDVVGEFELNNFYELLDDYENRLSEAEIWSDVIKEGEDW